MGSATHSSAQSGPPRKAERSQARRGRGVACGSCSARVYAGSAAMARRSAEIASGETARTCAAAATSHGRSHAHSRSMRRCARFEAGDEDQRETRNECAQLRCHRGWRKWRTLSSMSAASAANAADTSALMCASNICHRSSSVSEPTAHPAARRGAARHGTARRAACAHALGRVCLFVLYPRGPGPHLAPLALREARAPCGGFGVLRRQRVELQRRQPRRCRHRRSQGSRVVPQRRSRGRAGQGGCARGGLAGGGPRRAAWRGTGWARQPQPRRRGAQLCAS